ncbi:alanine:cation symporter family protein [Clostridium senegalense]|uniref:alanine/glycine:cation symporter family protein n=1 Tax=Clostridium senegalense TaxID=1465809 RepID=UPI001C1062FC|nr:alanine:cation symporter family protein [Clostridium senegalense]
MESFNNFIATANNYLWGYVLIALLLVLGIYFSIGTKFVQFRYIKEMFILLLNGGNKDKKKEGSVSSFQSFCISTASKVGTGNIAGVAIAVALGGPGAVFWMWLIALIGGASCFVECTLAQIYKVKDGNAYRGGPAYYMEKGLNKRWMGILFSILITISFGLIFNSVQANTISVAFNTGFGVSKTTIGIILVVATSLIIFGGVTRIARVSEIIVPIFAIAYIIVSLLVLVLNITQLPNILKIIFQNAFGLKAITSGGLGATIMQGVKRGLFSNEAGMGSSPNAAAAAEACHPVEQGLVQTLGVFVDTIIICSATAFIILSSGTYADSNLTGIELTQHALTSQIGSFGNYFIAICILLFAFSSIIGNYYYGESNIEFIKTNKFILTIYRICVVGMVMFGSLVKVEFVWNIADFFMGLMAIINLIAISLLGKHAFSALKDYTAQKKAGIKNPIFKSSSIPGLKNADEWKD